MEPLLGVKVGCLFSLLVLTLVCGLFPICFKWFQTATGRHRRVLSLLSCTSAGIFLGVGFMHMTAEALEGIESEIQKLVIQVSSRVAELQGCEARMMNRTRESNEERGKIMKPRTQEEQQGR
ncbi:zinc transporter ZIP2 isoform X2 [Delphinapterus leucas]|uniref:Zinc transporter ZIP2 isoform X2 n=1 Tax=Delphinapterus leucas TaxID=9749 RepID=A0A2Y9PBC2_DELLE|nr:zinc transporter ZIP2 isoform X2 [Delphinapterus leucas]XP_022443306.1 zinc transporter ZIP2 isoform X2 [Delphinapterus leucas]